MATRYSNDLQALVAPIHWPALHNGGAKVVALACMAVIGDTA
jgi:hypothetical protein